MPANTLSPKISLLKPLVALTFGAEIILSTTSAKALTFNFTPSFDTSTQEGASALAGFQEAGNLWSNIFTDDVVVNYNIGFADLGENTLAQASSIQQVFAYEDVYNALGADITSAEDQTAFDNLQTGPDFGLLINRTSNSPHGSGSDIPYLDRDGSDNNRNIRLTTANAKALGLQTTASVDATLNFNSAFDYDFDRSDGIIIPGTFDFVGIAAHEIGHALGFMSGVDVLDRNSPPANGPFPDWAFTYVSPLDLFRYSTDSASQGGIDWSANNQNKYFSIDGGVTQTALFTTGQSFGDGREASHWKDNQGIGIMEPAVSRGEFRRILDPDILAFDVIGWNKNASGNTLSLASSPASVSIASNSLTAASSSASVPEPGTVLGVAVIGAGLLLRANAKRKRDEN